MGLGLMFQFKKKMGKISSRDFVAERDDSLCHYIGFDVNIFFQSCISQMSFKHTLLLGPQLKERSFHLLPSRFISLICDIGSATTIN